MPAVLALPDIGAALAGVLLLVLAFALYLLRDILTGAFSHVPLVGGWISSALGGYIDDARNAVRHAAAGAFGGAEHLFKWASHYVTAMFGHLTHYLADVAGTIEHIATVQVPRMLAIARHDIAGTFDRVRHAAAHDLTLARHYTAHWFDVARHDTASALAAARHDTAHWFDIARHDTASALAAARHYTAARVDSLDQAVTSRIDQEAATAAADVAALRVAARQWFTKAELDAAKEVAAARTAASVQVAAARKGITTDLNDTAGAVLGNVWPGAAGDIEALKGALGADFPGLSDLVPALQGAGAAGLAGVLVRSLAGTALATRAVEQCVAPNCRNLSGLGHLLEGLLAASDAGILFELIAQMASDPAGAAADITAVFGPAVTAARDLVYSTVGV